MQSEQKLHQCVHINPVQKCHCMILKVYLHTCIYNYIHMRTKILNRFQEFRIQNNVISKLVYFYYNLLQYGL